MDTSAAALTSMIADLHRQAPDAVGFLDGPIEPGLQPGQLGDIGRHMRGFRIGFWDFDLLGEGMRVEGDPRAPQNGPPATYRAVMDTGGDGVYFVDVDPATGDTGAVLRCTRDRDVAYGGPSLLAFLHRAVAAALAALASSAAEIHDYAARYGEDLDPLETFNEYFGDGDFFHHPEVIHPVPCPAVTDPSLQDIAGRRPDGFLADLRTAAPGAFIPFSDHTLHWPYAGELFSRYHGGRVVVAHKR